MMHSTRKLMKVVHPVRKFIAGDMPANELVKVIDDLVAANLLSDLDPPAAALVDKLQTALALYVPDAMTRKEEPLAFIGPMDLLKEAQDFDNQVRLLGY